MEVLWRRGESTVREVMGQLSRPLAYTTVMTTLDRLFKKGILLRRCRLGRAFSYSPSVSQRRWDAQTFTSFVANLLTAPPSHLSLLMCCLVDVAGEQNEALLDELERKIQAKRRELDTK